jgi:dTMP kinase
VAGRFITFEGGEGAGKTTQLARLADWLEEQGVAVVRTREPGGTEGAEAIRALILEGAAARWLPTTELLLIAAARDDHVRRLVRPALERGAWVLCDRYLDSTFAYQGRAGGLGTGKIEELAALMDLPHPGLTFLLDLPVELGLERRHSGGELTRFEAKALSFHAAVRQGLLDRAVAEPERVFPIDASLPPDEVAAAIREIVVERFGLRAG